MALPSSVQQRPPKLTPAYGMIIPSAHATAGVVTPSIRLRASDRLNDINPPSYGRPSALARSTPPDLTPEEEKGKSTKLYGGRIALPVQALQGGSVTASCGRRVETGKWPEIPERVLERSPW